MPMTEHDNNTIQTSTLPDFSAIADAFERCAGEFCEKFGKETFEQATQSQFNALCSMVNQSVIAPNKYYYCVDEHYKPLINEWRYSTDKLNIIHEIFCRYASMYDKVPTFNAFCYLTGIDKKLLYEWAREYALTGVTDKRAELVKKINREEEQGLMDIGITGRRNPTGALEVLNVKHGHSAGIIRQEVAARASLPVAALPSFGTLHNVIDDKGGTEHVQDSAEGA